MSIKQKDLEQKLGDGFKHSVFSADMGDLAHATVMGLPAETVGPAEVPDVRAAGEVLPQHTAPGLEFGKEVGSAGREGCHQKALCFHLITPPYAKHLRNLCYKCCLRKIG